MSERLLDSSVSPRVLMLRIEPAPYTLALIRALKEIWQGELQVFFINEAASQPWKPSQCTEGIQILPPNARASARRIREAISDMRPNIVHVAGWSEPPIRAATISAALRGTPVVVELDTWRDQAAGMTRLLKQIFLPVYASLISRFAAGGSRQKRFLESYGVPGRKIDTVKMTVDITRLRSIDVASRDEARLWFRQQAQIDAHAPLALYVGRLVPYKGVDILLDAWRNVSVLSPKARLAIVGDGELMMEANRASKLDPSIRVVGRLEPQDVWRAYSAADLFVGPSRFEQWGLAVNEAMALELPVLVTDAFGCVGDLVEHEHTGLVVPPEDPAALADAIVRALGDSMLRRSFATAASERIRHWTIEAQAERICDTWRSAMASQAGEHR